MRRISYLFSLCALWLVCSAFVTLDTSATDQKKKGQTEQKAAQPAEKKAKKKKQPYTGKRSLFGKPDYQNAKLGVEETMSPNPIWAFGFSASFTDSTVYITDMQLIEDVKVASKTRFIEGRYDYSVQLKNYLENNLKQKNRVCVMMYATRKLDAERKYSEVRKRYTNFTHMNIKYLNASEFKFVKPQLDEQ